MTLDEVQGIGLTVDLVAVFEDVTVTDNGGTCLGAGGDVTVNRVLLDGCGGFGAQLGTVTISELEVIGAASVALSMKNGAVTKTRLADSDRGLIIDHAASGAAVQLTEVSGMTSDGIDGGRYREEFAGVTIEDSNVFSNAG